MNPNPPKDPYFDWRGAILNILFFGLLFYSLGTIVRNGDFTVSLILFLLSLIIGFVYIRKELRSSHPMFPIDLFRIRLYATSILTSTSSFIAQNLAIIALPFLFLSVLNFSELTTGLVMTPWPLATMIISPLAARWIEKHNAAFTAAFGMLIFMTGLLLLVLAPDDTNHWDIVWRMAICGIGFGFFQTPNNIVMVMATPVERTGAAGGMQSTARLTGQTMGSTIVSIVFGIMVTVSSSVNLCLYIALFFATFACIFSIDRGRQIIKRHVTL